MTTVSNTPVNQNQTSHGVDKIGFDWDAPLLDVRDLHVEFRTRAGVAHAINGVDFHLDQGETLAILGESTLPRAMSPVVRSSSVASTS